MLFSKTCEYGLQAMVYLAVVKKKVGIGEISKEQNLPSYYLSKILHSLVRAKLLDSAKGPKGGFWLNKKPKDITLADIVDAIDGMDSIDRCGMGLRKCDSNNPCAIHEKFKAHKLAIINIFKKTTLQTVIKEYESGDIVINLNDV